MANTQQAPKPDLAALKPKIEAMQRVRRDIETFVLDRQSEIKVSILALMALEHVLLYGPPGTGKSMAVNQLRRRIIGATMFEKLMHKGITYEDLFVSHKTNKIHTDPVSGDQTFEVIEHADGRPTAGNSQFVFMDEGFRGHNSTLNGTLTLINEGEFDLNGGRVKSPLMSMFVASNSLPDTGADEDLEAFFDRLLVRVPVLPVEDPAVQVSIFKTQQAYRRNLAGGITIPIETIDLADLVELQNNVPLIFVPQDVMFLVTEIARMVEERFNIRISVRRREWSLKILQARALLAGRDEVTKKDCTVLRFIFWNSPEDFDETEKLIRDNVLTPAERELDGLKDAAFEYVKSVKKRYQDGDYWSNGAAEEIAGIQGCVSRIDAIIRTEKKPEVLRMAQKLKTDITTEFNAILKYSSESPE